MLSSRDDVPGLDVNERLLVHILHGKLIDIFRLMDHRLLALESLLQGQKFLSERPIGAMDKEEAQISVGVWPLQGVFEFRSGRFLRVDSL
ncbi:MAG: hypothetical protein HYU36_03645 [Planctomycetes bacterium]|nr:hypothetical protein [Planctomycetota bacterium]